MENKIDDLNKKISEHIAELKLAQFRDERFYAEYLLVLINSARDEIQCIKAFEKQMENRCYGADETADALAWFSAGWKAK